MSRIVFYAIFGLLFYQPFSEAAQFQATPIENVLVTSLDCGSLSSTKVNYTKDGAANTIDSNSWLCNALSGFLFRETSYTLWVANEKLVGWELVSSSLPEIQHNAYFIGTTYLSDPDGTDLAQVGKYHGLSIEELNCDKSYALWNQPKAPYPIYANFQPGLCSIVSARASTIANDTLYIGGSAAMYGIIEGENPKTLLLSIGK